MTRVQRDAIFTQLAAARAAIIRAEVATRAARRALAAVKKAVRP